MTYPLHIQPKLRVAPDFPCRGGEPCEFGLGDIRDELLESFGGFSHADLDNVLQIVEQGTGGFG